MRWKPLLAITLISDGVGRAFLTSILLFLLMFRVATIVIPIQVHEPVYADISATATSDLWNDERHYTKRKWSLVEKPDIILLDIMMPGMNGYDVCRKIREKYSADQLPIIMLTAKNQITDLVTALNVGANDYISKPFSGSELLSRIKLHLNLANLSKKQRFIAMGELAAEIVHDLSTPINAIKVISRIIKNDSKTGIATLIK